MKTDAQLRDDVVQELRWDPQVGEPDSIGVAVADGAVTLTGHTTTYAEELAAARAAERVYGVKTVANDLQVRLAGSPRDDADIAKAIAHVLEWNVQIPTGRVQARVQDGWVSLDGQVDHDFQRHEIERMVRHVRGVVGITDNLSLVPPVRPVQVEAQIQGALERVAEVDARQVRVEVADHVARLYGHVHSLREAGAARAAAAAAPGVARVESYLTVLP
jgi:osmotically-inducible protein OsmY